MVKEERKLFKLRAYFIILIGFILILSGSKDIGLFAVGMTIILSYFEWIVDNQEEMISNQEKILNKLKKKNGNKK